MTTTTPTAANAIALFRSMIGTWTYQLNTHQWGAKKTDCQGAVDWVMIQLGMANRLGPREPYNVGYMVNHTTFAKAYPPEVPYPGDIVVLGDPRATDEHLRYMHTGMATDPGRYVSAYNERVDVIERAIDNTPTIRLVVILRTGLSGDVMNIASVTPVDGTVALNLDSYGKVIPSIRLLDLLTGDYLVPDDPTPRVTEKATIGPGQVTPKYATPSKTDPEPVWVTVCRGRLALILARNAGPLVAPATEPKPIPFSALISIKGVVNPDGSVTVNGG